VDCDVAQLPDLCLAVDLVNECRLDNQEGSQMYHI
jgi:hypothetical protein